MSARRARKSERVWATDEVLRIRAEGHHAVRELEKLIRGDHPEKNPMRQLRLYQKYSYSVLELVFKLSACNKAAREVMMMETPNSHLPWDEMEDEHLVECRARGEEIMSIAMHLGRSPAAVATRLSQLIGVPRSQIVTQYVDGTLDEEPVHGLFHGVARHVS